MELIFVFFVLALVFFPLDIEQDKLVKSESLHIIMINYIDAKIEQFLVIANEAAT